MHHFTVLPSVADSPEVSATRLRFGSDKRRKGRFGIVRPIAEAIPAIENVSKATGGIEGVHVVSVVCGVCDRDALRPVRHDLT